MRKFTNLTLVLLSLLLILSMNGCKDNEMIDKDNEIVTFGLIASKDGLEDFKLLEKDDDNKEWYNVVPANITKEYEIKVFKSNESCRTYLLYQDDLYELGNYFGGYGVTSFALADINEDSKLELYFTTSWGSGMHRSNIGYFDFADRKINYFDYSYVGSDMVLVREDDNTLSAYHGDIVSDDEDKIFVNMKLSKDLNNKVANIFCKDNVISIETFKSMKEQDNNIDIQANDEVEIDNDNTVTNTKVADIFIEPKGEINMNETDMKMNINININGTDFDVILEGNETSKELLDKLPLNITMSELNGNEKYYYFDDTFKTNSIDVKNVSAGDIMLYGDNCLVLFYDNFATSYRYTKIGQIENASNLKDIVGKDNIDVSISK